MNVSQAWLKVEESHEAGCHGFSEGVRGSPTHFPRLFASSPPFPPSPLYSFSTHSSELQPGKIFSKESYVSAKQSYVCYCMCVCVCVVPTCGPQEHFVAQVTVMCLFLTGCGGVQSLAGHCVKSGIKRKYQHRGLSHTQITHIHYA